MFRFLIFNYLSSMGVVFLILSFVFNYILSDGVDSFYQTTIEGFFFLDNVIVYILTLSFLKLSLINRNIFKKMEFDQLKSSPIETKVISFLSAFPFGLGVSSFIKALSKGSIDTKKISRGLTSSMLIYPTTVASGYIFDFYEFDSIFSVFFIGLPLCFFIIFSDFKGMNFSFFNFNVLFFSFFLASINVLYMYVFSFFLNGSFLLKQSLFFIVFSFFLQWRTIFKVSEVFFSIWRQVFFFIGVGSFSYSVYPLIESVNPYEIFNFLGDDFILIFPIFLVPILSMFLIHPLLLFISFSLLFSPPMLDAGFTEEQICVSWLVMIVNAQLLSPVSLTTVMASTNTNNNIFYESFLKHYKFCFVFGSISFFYLLFLR